MVTYPRDPLLVANSGVAHANPVTPTIKIVWIVYKQGAHTWDGTEEVQITGTGFTPGGRVWVGVNPGSFPLSHCPGSGWCSTSPWASQTTPIINGVLPGGKFQTSITLTNVNSYCPPSIRVDANDGATNTNAPEVTYNPSTCIW